VPAQGTPQTPPPGLQPYSSQPSTPPVAPDMVPFGGQKPPAQ
jgi:hypothetical protein